MASLSNAIARKHFLHDHDLHAGVTPTCYFCGGLGTDSWGFWVRADGTVDVDATSANGELPSSRITAACVRAAVKHLKSRTQAKVFHNF